MKLSLPTVLYVCLQALMLFSPAVQADDEEEVVAIDEYMPIGKEPFKINLSGRGDHLMVLEAQAYIRSERAKSALKLHLPKIRNDLLNEAATRQVTPYPPSR